MSKASYADMTKKDLVDHARNKGLKGYDGMKKDELVKALIAEDARNAKAKPSKSSKTTATPSPRPKPTAAPKAASASRTTTASSSKQARPTTKKIQAKKTDGPIPIKPLVAESATPDDRDLATRATKNGAVKDRLVLAAADPYWLHAFWELSSQSVQRAEAALGQDWHGARPILRLFDVSSGDTTSTSETPIRDIVIHGGCTRWYIEVPQPPRSYRVDIGYLPRRGEFKPLARSNVQTPPEAGNHEVVDEHWNGTEPDGESTHDMIDEQHRPLKEPAFGSGAVLPGKLKKFFFDIDAELIVYGKTDPNASVTLQNELVPLRPNGSFAMRFSLPESRQIIPAVATSTDGMEEQTIVLAIERNTKRLDPMVHDLYGDG